MGGQMSDGRSREDSITETGSRLIDLSLGIHNNMPAHRFFPSPILLPYATHETSVAAGLGTREDPMTYAVSCLATLEHVGTHVDAPLHIDPAGVSIEKMSLDWYVGTGICLDLRHVGDLE